MDVFEAVRTLLAVRKYRGGTIPPDVVQRIVEAAHLTASSMNKQPWHFVVVQDPETLKKLGGVLTTGPYTADSAMAIAVAIDPTNRWSVSDGSRAIQSMMLTAWDAGVGSNWVGFAGGGLDSVKPLLGIPEELDVLAVIPFGYPATNVGKGKKERKPLGEVVSREQYGTPFS